MTPARPRTYGWCHECGPAVSFTSEREQRDHLAQLHGGHGRIEFLAESPHGEDQGTRAGSVAPLSGAGPQPLDELPSDDARALYAPPPPDVRPRPVRRAAPTAGDVELEPSFASPEEAIAAARDAIRRAKGAA